MAYRYRSSPGYSSNPYSELTTEIKEEFKSIELAANSTLEDKFRWCEELQQIVQRALPGSRLILVGSSTNLFGFKHSDCDLTVITRESYVSEMGCLSKIEEALKPYRRRYKVESVYGAKVPILKIRDDISDYEGDISINQKCGVQSTYLLKCYALMDPRVRPLALIIKRWAQKAGICDARQHKLSGFAVILLILHYLQKGCTDPVIPSLQATFPRFFASSSSVLSLAEKLSNTKKDSVPYDVRSYSSRNTQTLGELLVGFFKFYSNFSWEKVISIRTGDYIPLSNYSEGTWRKPQIRIEDPYQRGNVTKAVYQISVSYMIKEAFGKASRELERDPSLTAIM
ncbi:poly(A) RNA polymerase GLD2-A-like [Dendronephthya gigantea]|uniref:poly(A) RNA polymerase GLD2-A-like n=1 Tax=Dendronephthya gigantea TaxID=151771 RepID=UPI00106B7E14|nr:poly(A) RNA polymerase GLD2-A-like [Dendronephthya gigantea]